MTFGTALVFTTAFGLSCIVLGLIWKLVDWLSQRE